MTFDENCNKDIGIYHVNYVCDYKYSDTDRHKVYHATCNVCGKEFETKLSNIKRTKTCTHVNSVGILKEYRDTFKVYRLRHILSAMLRRCLDPNDKSYRWYGAKGIKVCNEWLDNPKSFEDWALANGYKAGLTIDRIDSNKDYSPDNCRWITQEENSRRAGKVNWITVNNLTMSGRQWSKYLSLGENYINTLIRNQGLEYTVSFIKQKLELLA